MSEFALETRNQLVGLFGIVERNVYLTKRYFLWDIAFMFWTIANTLTIVFIARAANLPPAEENTLAMALLVGATIWAFLGIIFEFMTETVAWERWEGTIEYTFMAPLSRAMHLAGQGLEGVFSHVEISRVQKGVEPLGDVEHFVMGLCLFPGAKDHVFFSM